MPSEIIKNATWPQIKVVLSDPTMQVGLFGPPGVGKTYSLFEMASAKQDRAIVVKSSDVKELPAKSGKGKGKATTAAKPAPEPEPEPEVVPPTRYVGKVQFHSELAPPEVMGMHVPDGDKFRWEAGPADLAYSQGGLLILDEIDMASGPMKSYLMGLLDRGPGGTISYVGRTFVQQPGYQAVATMNDRPDAGTLPEALLDRFDCWFMVTSPSEEQLNTLDPDLREICVDAYASASDPLKGPEVTYRLLASLQKLRRLSLPLDVAVLGACHGNKTLATSLLEVLRLS